MYPHLPYNPHWYFLVLPSTIPYLASCYTLLVSHSCIFSHNHLLIIKGKPRFLAIVYKTTRNLILPCLSDFFFFCHLFLTLYVQASRKDSNCFFSNLMLSHACLLLPTPLCFLNTPPIIPDPQDVSFNWWTPTQLPIFSSCQFLSHNNNYDNNTNLPPLDVPLMKRIIYLILEILSLASTSLLVKVLVTRSCLTLWSHGL